MDKKMLVEAFKQLLKHNWAKEVKSAQNTKVNFSKLSKPIKVGNVAIKMAETLVAMNAVDALAAKMHQLLPRTTDGLEWLHALPSKIANATIGQIPILGAIYRWINNAIAEGFAKLSDALGNETLANEARKRKRVDPDEGFNASYEEGTHTLSGSRKEKKEGDETMTAENRKKLINAPSFYENLDLHKTFSIPGAYTKKTVINGTLATPKLAVHRIVENPAPDVSAAIDRTNQKFALIKAVRGLSATKYDVIDLYNYERFAKLILLEYYVTKKVIQAAKTYSLVQTGISDNIIKAYGFDPTEVRNNLANYETLLCQIHRFITNNLPITGTWIKRLEYLVGANVPDYSDAKVATIHMFAVSISNIFYDRSEDGITNYHTFDCIPNSNNNSYSVLLTNFLSYQQDLINNDNWQQLIADYFGAFAKQAMWSDKDYPQYKEPLNLRNSDSDLSREQIKNAFYLNAKVEFITIDAGVINAKYRTDLDDPAAIQLNSYQFGNTFDSTAATATTLTYVNILDSDAYLKPSSAPIGVSNLGSTNVFLLPDHNGVGAQAFEAVDGGNNFIDMNNHETIYTLHKDSYTEGEALEISQFKARSVGANMYVASSIGTVLLEYYFKTQEYAMMDTFIYTFGSNGTNIVEQNYVLCDEAISDDDLQDTESPVDYPDEIMSWALVDWMPLMHTTFFGYNSSTQKYSPRDIALIDMDSFGSLDDRAFSTSINYSIYSLLGAGLKIGKKRVDNLASVYEDKPSRQG